MYDRKILSIISVACLFFLLACSPKPVAPKAELDTPDCSGAYFYMGLAYKMSYNFQKAAGQFNKVLELDKGFVEEADKEYAIIQKIERAMPGTPVGKKIALFEKITRAEPEVEQYL